MWLAGWSGVPGGALSLCKLLFYWKLGSVLFLAGNKVHEYNI